MKTIISNTLLIISIIILLWVGLSWLEVITFNVSGTHEYFKFNFFQIMINGGK